jgi:hypothetical protein
MRSDPRYATSCAGWDCRKSNGPDLTLHTPRGGKGRSGEILDTTPGEQQYHPSAEAFR